MKKEDKKDIKIIQNLQDRELDLINECDNCGDFWTFTYKMDEVDTWEEDCYGAIFEYKKCMSCGHTGMGRHYMN